MFLSLQSCILDIFHTIFYVYMWIDLAWIFIGVESFIFFILFKIKYLVHRLIMISSFLLLSFYNKFFCSFPSNHAFWIYFILFLLLLSCEIWNCNVICTFTLTFYTIFGIAMSYAHLCIYFIVNVWPLHWEYYLQL